MTGGQFVATLEELGIGLGELSRFLQALGDPAEPATIVRRLQRMASGEHTVSGEMTVILELCRLFPGVRALARRGGAPPRVKPAH